MNSLAFSPVAIEGMINKTIRDDREKRIVMPPTKVTLNLLFKKLNLYVPSLKVMECLVHCRGKNMEEEPPENFHMSMLVEWFEMNLRSLKHIDEMKVDDREWYFSNRKRRREANKKSLSPVR